MNEKIYQAQPLAPRSFFQQLFKQLPEENAIIEVNNLLATKLVKEISENEIKWIENRYQLNLNKEFGLNMEEFYAVYLNYCLKDKILSGQELDELQHLKTILRLEEKSLEQIHTRLGEIIYRTSFREAVADGHLTKEEEVFLNKLENTLRLPKALAEKISAEVRKGFVEEHVARIVADQRLSPDEERELEVIAGNLNVSLHLNDQTREQFRKLKLYWALENLALPLIQPDIVIQKSEVCHIKVSNVSWYELRRVRQQTLSPGYTTSFRIAKGFYLRPDGRNIRSNSTDTPKLIDKGTLYLTNKRIIFTGAIKNSNIRIDRILNFTPYTDGLTIDKETGKSPTLQMAQHADLFCLILERLLNDR